MLDESCVKSFDAIGCSAASLFCAAELEMPMIISGKRYLAESKVYKLSFNQAVTFTMFPVHAKVGFSDESKLFSLFSTSQSAGGLETLCYPIMQYVECSASRRN